MFFLYMKMLTGYYKKNIEKLSRKTLQRYQNLSEKKDKKHKFAREWYWNASEDEEEK